MNKICGTCHLVIDVGLNHDGFDCLEALKNELKAKELQLRERDALYESQAAASRKDMEAMNRLNGELKGRVEMLTASLESILKREYGLDFQTYLKSKEAGPLTRVLLDELIAQLPDNTKKRNHAVICNSRVGGVCNCEQKVYPRCYTSNAEYMEHDYQPFPVGPDLKCSRCGLVKLV